jgi:nucleotide-binding universal stress UspA family protein
VVSDIANEVGADLIVIGTESGIDKKSYLVDSPVYKIMSTAPCHVLAVPANQTFSEFEHILYPVMGDGTPLDNLPVAKAIIEKNNATVSVIRVIQKDDAEVIGSLKKLSDSIRRKSNIVARSVQTRPLYTSNPAKGLTKLSREENAGLVVIESKTQRSLKEFFTGSFTQKMLRNQEVAVLCAKNTTAQFMPALNGNDVKNFHFSY